MKLAIVFSHAPHGTAHAREGLDALLAASNFCYEDDIGVFFMGDGVFNLLPNQQGEHIGQKDFTPAFKLLDLYDIEQRFACQESWNARGLTQDPSLDVAWLSATALNEKLRQAEKILTF